MPWGLLPLAQTIPPPDPNAAPWAWVAAAMASAVGVVFWRLDTTHKERIQACNDREKAKDATIEKKDATIDALRTELQETARESVAATAKQLEAAQEQARAHAEERRVLLGLLGKEGAAS